MITEKLGKNEDFDPSNKLLLNSAFDSLDQGNNQDHQDTVEFNPTFFVEIQEFLKTVDLMIREELIMNERDLEMFFILVRNRVIRLKGSLVYALEIDPAGNLVDLKRFSG
jgi:hypothetical protein